MTSGAIVSSGGSLVVDSTMAANGTTINSGGVQYVQTGATASGTVGQQRRQ